MNSRRDFVRRLRAVDWSAFTTAYGSARRVPWWLFVFRFGPRPCAARAGHRLWCSLCHQHAYVSSAALPALPFVLEVLDRREAALVAEALDLLLGFLRGTAPGIEPAAAWHLPLRDGVLAALPDVQRFTTASDPDVAALAQAIHDETNAKAP